MNKKTNTDHFGNVEFKRLLSAILANVENVIGGVKSRLKGLNESMLNIIWSVDMAMVVNFIATGYILHNILVPMSDR